MRKELVRELAQNLEGPTFIDTSVGQVLEMSSTLHQFLPIPPKPKPKKPNLTTRGY
jgi:hypothetical protein